MLPLAPAQPRSSFSPGPRAAGHALYWNGAPAGAGAVRRGKQQWGAEAAGRGGGCSCGSNSDSGLRAAAFAAGASNSLHNLYLNLRRGPFPPMLIGGGNLFVVLSKYSIQALHLLMLFYCVSIVKYCFPFTLFSEYVCLFLSISQILGSEFTLWTDTHFMSWSFWKKFTQLARQI